MNLLLIVPTRARKAQCERLIESFDSTANSAELLFVIDGDDDSYQDMDWKGHASTVMSPRGTLAQKLNHTVDAVGDKFGAVMWCGDSREFATKGWDTQLLRALEEMGGSGWVYPDNGRNKAVPEIWLASTDVVRELSWFACPAVKHFCLDHAVNELGKRSGLIRRVPEVLIKRQGPSNDEVTRESITKYAEPDTKAFTAWRASPYVAADISRLRRKFNPDVAWVMERAA